MIDRYPGGSNGVSLGTIGITKEPKNTCHRCGNLLADLTNR